MSKKSNSIRSGGGKTKQSSDPEKKLPPAVKAELVHRLIRKIKGLP
jgi:hypothetical protein